MKPRLAAAFSLAAILAAVGVLVAGSSPKVETISGRIVAYADGLTCLNGSAYWSMLIHIKDRRETATKRFIQVRFSLPCKESPQWLNREPPLQKFRLKREQGADSVLKEFIDCAPKPCSHTPMWRLVPGADAENFPFGHVVPSYRSLDLPLVPVV